MVLKRMKLKKKRKFIRFKTLIYISFVYIGFIYSFYYYMSNKKTVSNEEFIRFLVNTGNANISKEYKMTNIVNKTMDFVFDIDFTIPSSLLNSSILKFGNNTEVKTISLEYNDDYSNMEELDKVSDYIEDPNPTTLNEPIIYLYNSHQLENYSNKDLSLYGITPNVLMASYILRENLNKLGLTTVVEEANMKEILNKNNWNYSYSYQVSRSLMKEKISKYKTLKYFIDIHRDSISHEYSTVSINGKNYAKIMFVVGLDHNNWEANYNLSKKLYDLLNKYYPGITRSIMKKEGANVNGIYNQDVSPNCILIEVGGVDNTIEEVYNTMEAISNILSKYINGED